MVGRSPVAMTTSATAICSMIATVVRRGSASPGALRRVTTCSGRPVVTRPRRRISRMAVGPTMGSWVCCRFPCIEEFVDGLVEAGGVIDGSGELGQRGGPVVVGRERDGFGQENHSGRRSPMTTNRSWHCRRGCRG